ncbi:FUSC family protein [Propioniciclava soli]|uniref:FUSC family protein n=1 Tax=Propioniciclava soli TaxID=2775081 RepID=A0ABZ3CAP6_9ACTN
MPDSFLVRTTERLDLRRRGVFVGSAVRQGFRRVRGSLFPIVVAAFGASLAWLVAERVFGHTSPIFAPIAAWVCLGFKVDREPRKVAELGLGASVGVLIGELLTHFFDAGWWQIGVVLVVAACFGRFIDRGDLTTMQAGVNGIVIVGMSWLDAALGGVQSRWVEALIGVSVAFVIAVLLPRHPTSRPRRYATSALIALAEMLELIGRGLTTGDREVLGDVKAQRRVLTDVSDDWERTIKTARDVVGFNPALRRHRGEVAELGRLFRLLRRAVRSAMLLERQAVGMTEEVGWMPEVGGLVSDTARAARLLADAVRTWSRPDRARALLLDTAAQLAPSQMRADYWRSVALMVLLRALVVDLLQMTGLSRDAARAALAETEGRPFADDDPERGPHASDDGASPLWG